MFTRAVSTSGVSDPWGLMHDMGHDGIMGHDHWGLMHGTFSLGAVISHWACLDTQHTHSRRLA